MSINKVKKAVIPAAGFGTRVLPASKAIPKEMIPIVDKPAIQYIIQEAKNSGVEDILVITSYGKEAIENHFDRNFELEYKLKKANKTDIYESIIEVSNLANIFFIRQKEVKGLGSAILYAEDFIKDEPFCVLYADDIIDADYPVSKQLIDVYNKYEKPCLGIRKVREEEIYKYSSLKVEHIENNVYNITDMIEKPKTKDEVLSLYSILGRCLLTADIFDIIKTTKEGSGGEIQLTDSINTLSKTKGTIGVEFIGNSYDMGNKFGILKANIEMGLKHNETKDLLLEYLKNLKENI